MKKRNKEPSDWCAVCQREKKESKCAKLVLYATSDSQTNKEFESLLFLFFVAFFFPPGITEEGRRNCFMKDFMLFCSNEEVGI